MVVLGIIVLIINTLLYLSIFLKSGTDERFTAFLALILATCNILTLIYLARVG